jgi:disease resistance protein RPM1
MCNELPCELEKDDKVPGILNLSYYDLPSDLRNCFVYCSLFPEDCHFSKDDLVRLWVAEGFVEKKGDSTPEEVAEGYLTELIHRNMLQLVENDELGRVNTCKMHDILRELALYISKAEMFGTVNDFGAMVQMDTDVRRISSYGWKKTKKNKSKMKLPHLQTLMASDTIVDYVPSILSESKYLTVLELQNSDFQELPTSIGNLFNLKYIGLRNTRITLLPDSINNLCNLQTLDVKSTSIKALPPAIVMLTKLRHLLADKFADKNQSEFRYFIGVEAPEGLSNLEDLQTLETVQASMDLLEQLDKLLHLRSLWIDNITSAHCAGLFATLSTMPLLSSLLLSAADENETLLLNHFIPTCMKLHKLIVRGFWSLTDCPIFQNHGRYLKYLALSRCHFVGDPLVVLASTVPNITYLRLNNIPSPPILDLPEGSFPHLKTLVLKNMNDVSLLKISNGALPVIECLYITSLPKLETVPQGIKSLGSLKKLWLLDLHSNFKAQWDMAGMQKDLQHVLEIRA